MLFCPFCREAFDDLDRCPHHDVALVSLRELGQLSAADVPDDKRVPLWSPHFGRGWVALGAVCTLLSFLGPFGELTGDVEISNTLLHLARGRALRLWVVPVAAFALFLTLYRRRSPAAMRGARLGTLIVACLPSAVVGFTWRGAVAAAEAMAGTGNHVTFQLGLGSYAVFASGAIAILGSLRMGIKPARRIH